MSEVEKLYKNAGVEPKAKCTSQTCIVTNPHKNWCNKCESLDYDYPLFTAEKQLSLIKFLSNFWVHINKVNGQFNISTGGGYVSYFAEDLADAIALYINSKWNNLTDQERTEIAEILKG